MADKNAEPLLPVELGPGKVKFAQGMKAGRWVFATGADGAGLQERHRAGCAGGAGAARRPAQAREGGAAHLREPRRRAARRRHRPQQPRPHRPVLHDGEGRAALSAGPARVPRRPHSALDLDRPAGPAAARRRHEHPGARRHSAAGLRGRRITSTRRSPDARPRAIRRRSPSATSSSFPASPRSRSATSRGATASPRRR